MSLTKSSYSMLRGAPVNVLDFGALGDGTGRTPADTGVDILNAPWNTWDNTPFKDLPAWSPFYANPQGTFQPARVKPFANDDTWDYIGISLALWAPATAGGKSVYLPAGNYKINATSATPKGGYQGLLIMKDQEQAIFGAGPYETEITWKESAVYFNNTSVGANNTFKLFTLYRTGGPPTNLAEFALVGPSNYSATANNMTLLNCENINGVTFRDLWLSSAFWGIAASTSSGDSHAREITSEFLFGASLYCDATSDITVDFVNFWASATVPGQKGIDALGRVCVTNSRFVGFYGNSIKAANGVISNNLITAAAGDAFINITSDCIINGNQITGSSPAPMIFVVSNATIVGNYIKQTANHPCINVGDGTASSATYLNITGNTFIKTNSASEPQNYAIVAIENNVGYTEAATASTLITSNTFQGRALNTIGAATMANNII